MGLAAVEIDPLAGAQFYRIHLQAERDAALQPVQGYIARDVVRGDRGAGRHDQPDGLAMRGFDRGGRSGLPPPAPESASVADLARLRTAKTTVGDRGGSTG